MTACLQLRYTIMRVTNSTMKEQKPRMARVFDDSPQNIIIQNYKYISMDVIYANEDKPYIFDNYLKLNSQTQSIVKALCKSCQPQLSVNTFGQAIFYIQTPFAQHKQTILFIHGFGGTSLTWIKLIQHLKGKYNCIAIDVPGSGLSSKIYRPKAQPLSQQQILDYYQSRIMSFIKKKKLKNLVLCCHSFGGFIGSYVLSKNQRYFKRAMLLSPFPGNQPFIYGNYLQRTTQTLMYKFDIHPQKTYVITAAQNYFLKTVGLIEDEQTWRKYLTIIGKSNQQNNSESNFFDLFGTTGNDIYNISNFLKKGYVPVLFLYGQIDWMPHETIKRLKLMRNNVYLHIVPKIGHQVQMSDYIYKYY